MNILLISAYFPPDTGSASHLFYELALSLNREHHKVGVLTSFPSYYAQGSLSKYKKKIWMKEDMEGISVTRVAIPVFSRNILAARALWQFNCAFLFGAASLFLPHYDISLVYSPPLPLGYTAWFLRKIKGTPFILNVQDLFPQSAIDLKKLRSKQLIYLFEGMEKQIYNCANLITVHSQGNRDHMIMKEAKSKKVRVIPNWIDTEFIKPGKRMNSFRREHVMDDKFVVSFAGILGYSQDIEVIIGAAEILKDYHNIFFLIVGDGARKQDLVDEAKKKKLENIKFIGMQPREKYPDVLHASNVCLSTLKSEVITPVVPSKILSIMAAGRPIIASMNLSGDAGAIIEEARCGYVIPPGNPNLLAEHILKLHKNRENCEIFGKNGRKYAETNLSLKISTHRYVSLFEELLSKKEKEQ